MLKNGKISMVLKSTAKILKRSKYLIFVLPINSI